MMDEGRHLYPFESERCPPGSDYSLVLGGLKAAGYSGS